MDSHVYILNHFDLRRKSLRFERQEASLQLTWLPFVSASPSLTHLDDVKPSPIATDSRPATVDVLTDL